MYAKGQGNDGRRRRVGHSQQLGRVVAVRAHVMGHDGVVIDGLAGLQVIGLAAVDHHQLALEYQDEFLALMRDGLLFVVLVGIDLDEKRLHVAVALALAQRLIDVAGTGGAAGVHGGVHAAQLVHAGNDGIAGELVVQEGAQTDAQRAGHLLQGADGGIYLVIFHAFQKIDGQSRIL